jgi:predicted transcriptional regulator
MAMNVWIPEDLDKQLDAVAAATHTSKSTLLLQGAQLVVERHARRNVVDASLDFVKEHDAELLKRLDDA